MKFNQVFFGFGPADNFTPINFSDHILTNYKQEGFVLEFWYWQKTFFILYILRFSHQILLCEKAFKIFNDQSKRQNDFVTGERIILSNYKQQFKRIVSLWAFLRSLQVALSRQLWQDNIFGVLELFVIQTYQELGYIFEDGWISVYMKNKQITAWKEPCTGFSHTYQKSHSFAALIIRSISDTSPTRVKIPYARTISYT